MQPLLGIVIPTLDEAAHLPHLLDDLAALSVPHRIVVADGGSTDSTVNLAESRGLTVIGTTAGRARQMNAGAAGCHTPWLLFLHADSRVSKEAAVALASWLESTPPTNSSAHFAFGLRGDGGWWRVLERGQRARQRWFGLVYGDQGLLVHRTMFDAVGGFPLQPVFEDLAMVAALRRHGPVRELSAVLETSPRRYESEGKLRGWLRNVTLTALYLVGVSPDRLATWYRARGGSGRDRILLVFAKAPIPGRVKTRVAEELGHERAAEVYRELGRLVTDQVRRGPYRTIVCYDPPGDRAVVSDWLGRENVEYWPQEPGGLGARLVSAFEAAFRNASQVCVIGTDAPDVDEEVVRGAFDGLDHADVVMGPAEDGGYYLLALARPTPELFDDMPWSTSSVAHLTRQRAALLGLTLAELPSLADVDYADDVPEALR